MIAGDYGSELGAEFFDRKFINEEDPASTGASPFNSSSL